MLLIHKVKMVLWLLKPLVIFVWVFIFLHIVRIQGLFFSFLPSQWEITSLLPHRCFALNANWIWVFLTKVFLSLAWLSSMSLFQHCSFMLWRASCFNLITLRANILSEGSGKQRGWDFAISCLVKPHCGGGWLCQHILHGFVFIFIFHSVVCIVRTQCALWVQGLVYEQSKGIML